MLKPPSPGNAPNEAMTQAPRRARVGDHPVRGLGIETCKGSSIPQVVSRDTGEQIGLAALRAQRQRHRLLAQVHAGRGFNVDPVRHKAPQLAGKLGSNWRFALRRTSLADDNATRRFAHFNTPDSSEHRHAR